MKKLTLTTLTVAVALVPTLSHAAYEKDRSAERSEIRTETYNRVDLNGNVIQGERRVSSGGADFIVDIDRTDSAYVTRSGMPAYTFLTPEGQRILIEGEAVYMVSENGNNKFFAPNAAYTAPNGLTFVAENGILLRTEVPDQTAYVFTDGREGVDVKMVTPR